MRMISAFGRSKGIILLLLTPLFLTAQKKPEKKYPALLWEITGNGLTKPSYLFGTMHVSSKLVFHLSDSFYTAIKNAEVVALELDPQLWQDQLYRYQNMQGNLRSYSQGSPNDYLNEKSFQLEKYEDRIKTALSDEPTLINGLLYRTVQPKADFEEDTYLDLYIYQTGKRFGKMTTGVENYVETEKLILEASQDMMKDRKKKTFDNNGESMYEIERKTQEAYRKGDLDLLDSLERLMQTSAAYMEKFLYRRNEIQANSIDSILGKHSLFVGVGAAHLPNQRGVIELLRRKGYHLRPVSMQDRDGSLRDDVEKVKVPVVFSNFTSDDGLFSVQSPGNLYKRSDGRANDSWQYADMSNGAYYMVSRVKTHGVVLGNSPETVLRKVDSLLYENIPGKIIRKKPVVVNGYRGFDITNRTRRGDIQRYTILVTPFEVLVFKMSGNASYVEGPEAEQFFGSIQVKHLPDSKTWVDFSPRRGGFSARFPHPPFENRYSGNFDGVPRWEYEAYDSASGEAFLIWRRNIQNLHFLEENAFDLDLMEESFHLSEFIDKTLGRQPGMFRGRPCLNATYKLKDGALMQARFLIKGSQYIMMAARAQDKWAHAASFFDSFSFRPFIYSGFRNYADSFVNFTVSTPVVPDIDFQVRTIMERTSSEEFLNSMPEYSYYWPRPKTALFQDDSTGESVYVSVQSYLKYYYPKDSATFWKEEVNEKRIREDLIIKSREPFRFNDSVYGFKYVYSDTNTTRILRNWIFLKDNRLYRIMSMRDSLDDDSEFIDRFFYSFRPTQKKMGEPLFRNKLDVFFRDFYSSDSATSKRAREAIPNIYFGKAGLSRLVGAIGSLGYNSRDYFSTKTKLINELGYINDSSVVGQVVETLKGLYEKAGDTSTFQNAVLKALARHKTAPAYELLKVLLVQDPPVFDNNSDYNYLFQQLGDSLRLARTLFPELLQLSTVDDYKDNVHSLLTTLVDSGYMKASDYEPYFSKLYFDAKIQLKKQLGRDEQQFQQKAEEGGESEKLEETEKTDGDPSNDLEDDAVLLMPFYDRNATVPRFFDKLLKSSDESLKMSAAVLLIRNHKRVPDSVLNGLASSDKYRFPLYKRLLSIHQEILFPQRYLDQVDMARSQLVSTRAGKDVFAIEYVDKRQVRLKQETGFVYFFKYKLSKDEKWQIGISGLQPLNHAAIGTGDELVKFTNKNIGDHEPLSEQFDKQLLRLIFSRHKSAASFYLDSDYYVGRGDE